MGLLLGYCTPTPPLYRLRVRLIRFAHPPGQPAAVTTLRFVSPLRRLTFFKRRMAGPAQRNQKVCASPSGTRRPRHAALDFPHSIVAPRFHREGRLAYACCIALSQMMDRLRMVRPIFQNYEVLAGISKSNTFWLSSNPSCFLCSSKNGAPLTRSYSFSRRLLALAITTW